jgi:hypothetical protein
MSLQRRLTLYFVAPIIVTLLMAGFIVQNVVSKDITRRAELPLTPSLLASGTIFAQKNNSVRQRVDRLGKSSQLSALLTQGSPKRLHRYLHTLITQSSDVDFLIATDTAGNVVGYAQLGPPQFLRGFRPPRAADIANANSSSLSGPITGPGFSRTMPAPLMGPLGNPVGNLIGGFWIDDSLVYSASPQEVHLSVAATQGNQRQVIASSVTLPRAQKITIPRRGIFDTNIGGTSVAKASRLGNGLWLVASTALAPLQEKIRSLLVSLFALLVLALFGTSALAYLLARFITQPLEQLSEAAGAIADGNFDYRIPIKHAD